MSKSDRESIWIVVHGEAYIPEAFDTQAEAEEFADSHEDDYVSGPWEVQLKKGD